MGRHTNYVGPVNSEEASLNENSPDLWFYWDPVCPFAWITSRWVNEVVSQRGYTVDWRFISLRLLNSKVDYDSHFPPEYEAGHTAGLRMLRVAAALRDQVGKEVMGQLYSAMGETVFDRPQSNDESSFRQTLGSVDHLAEILRQLGHDPAIASAADDPKWDEIIQSETDEALSLCGKDVGTPIIAFDPPNGTAFFGPVISRVPEPNEALELWDAVVSLARFSGFAELKRSLRERPQLRSYGVEPGSVGKVEDWHAGSRRQKK